MMLDEREPQVVLRMTVGSRVYTKDGVKTGSVKEIRSDGFKIDVPWRPDFWLSKDLVELADPEQVVVLRIESNELGEHKIEEPAA